MILSIHALRALAVLLVLASHIFDLTNSSGHTLQSPILVNLSNLGAVGVDVFFVISGMVMNHILSPEPRDSVRIFSIKRLIRIYPNVIIFTLLTVLVFTNLNQANFSIKEIVYSCLLKPGITGSFVPIIKVSWSLYHELFFYGLIALVMLLNRRRTVLVVSLTIGVLSTVGIFVRSSSGVVNLLINPINLEFVLGIVIYELVFKGKFVQRNAAWVAIIIGVAILTAEMFTGYRGVDSFILTFENMLGGWRTLLWGVPVAFIVFGLVRLWKGLSKLPGWVHSIADSSYALYLMQMILFGLIDFYFIDAVQQQPYIFAIGILVVFPVVSHVYHVYLEKKMNRWLKRVLLKNYVR